MPAEKQPIPSYYKRRIAFYDAQAKESKEISELISHRPTMSKIDAEILLDSDKKTQASERLAEQIRSEFDVPPLHIVTRLNLKREIFGNA